MRTEYERKRDRIKRGLCKSCVNPQLPGQNVCQRCLERNRATAAARRLLRKQNALCVCGKPIIDGFKKCSECRAYLRGRNKRIKLRGLCQKCSKPTTNNKVFCDHHTTEAAQRMIDVNVRLKLDAISQYSETNTCFCCSENRVDALTIDHINNDGAEHRRVMKINSGIQTYRWLKNNNYQPGFRVACWNCNCSIGSFGYCPHCPENKCHKPYKPLPAKTTLIQPCADCPAWSEPGKLYCLKHSKLRSDRVKAKFAKDRLTLIDHYSNNTRICHICGINHLEFLTINHDMGNGNQHRRDNNNFTSLSRWLLNNGLPSGYSIMCWTCNHLDHIERQRAANQK